MKIGTILFTYSRYNQTRAVIESLQNNLILPEELYIFQDGKKESTNIEEWNAVNKLISEIKWCKTNLYISEKNYGLAKSVIKGITEVLKNNDAVIVLEDDCIPHPQFMEYMVKSLEKYKSYSKVYAVNAYSYPLPIEKNGTSAYFTGRIQSWGWGTWKEKWNIFDCDYRILTRIKKDPVLNKRFHTWGEDLESYLYGNISGICDSWATFWALNVIEHEGFCVTPYKSFIDNRGFDGSGTHSGKINYIQNIHPFDSFEEIVLPDLVEFPRNSEELISNFYAWTSREEKLACYNKILTDFIPIANKGIIAKKLLELGYDKIAVWGRGKVSELFINEVCKYIEVKCIVESSPKIDFWEEKKLPIMKLEDLPNDIKATVVIPCYDKDKILDYFNKKNNLKFLFFNDFLKECNINDKLY